MDLKRLNRFAEKGENFLASVAIIVLCLIIASVCLEIIMRYFLNRPLFWVVELTEYALLYVTFLGSAWLLRDGGHVRVDVILTVMGPRWKHRCAVFSAMLGLLVSIVLTLFGAFVTVDHFQRSIFKPTILEFPTGAVLIAIPIGSLFLVLRFFYLLLDHVTMLSNEARDRGAER